MPALARHKIKSSTLMSGVTSTGLEAMKHIQKGDFGSYAGAVVAPL